VRLNTLNLAANFEGKARNLSHFLSIEDRRSYKRASTVSGLVALVALVSQTADGYKSSEMKKTILVHRDYNGPNTRAATWQLVATKVEDGPQPVLPPGIRLEGGSEPAQPAPLILYRIPSPPTPVWEAEFLAGIRAGEALDRAINAIERDTAEREQAHREKNPKVKIEADGKVSIKKIKGEESETKRKFLSVRKDLFKE